MIDSPEDIYKLKNDNIENIYNQWKDNEYLSSFSENHRKQMAVILDNQSLYLERYKDEIEKIFRISFSTIKEIALTLTQKVYFNHPIFDLVSVQTSLGPVNVVFYKELELRTRTVCMISRKLKSFIDESLNIDLLAKDIREELKQMVINDIYKNTTNIVQPNCISNDQIDLLNKMDWAIANPETSMTTLSDISSLKVIVEQSFPANEILCGKKRNLLDAYIFSPYILLSSCHTLSNEPSQYHFMTRFGRALISDKHYARIKLN